jgi:hypothetical protein
MYTLNYLSDGVQLSDKSIFMVDAEVKLPRGKYIIRNCKVNGVQADSLYLETKGGEVITPGIRKTETPQLHCKKVYYEKVITEYFEPKEEFEPDFGQRLPYESMFRMFAKMYGLKTQEELDQVREEDIDLSQIDDEEDRYVLSTMGLYQEKVTEPETPSEDAGEEISEEVQSQAVEGENPV